MNPSDLYRVLAFERLETKRSPTSLLVLLAPTEDDLHIGSENAVEQRQVDTAAHWRQHHRTDELLHFVEQQTAGNYGSGRPWTTPGPANCAAADQLMKLQDDDLRALLIAESLQQQN